MTQSNLPPTTPPAQTQPQPARKKRKWILRTILFLILALIVLLPNILNMGFVRSMVLSKVNENLTGKVTIASWSFSWFGSTTIEDIKIQQDNLTTLSVDKVHVGLNMWRVLTGGMYNLGDVTVSNVKFLLIQYPDGTNNFSRLPKTPSTEPLELPQGLKLHAQGDFSGEVHRLFLNNTVSKNIIGASKFDVNIADVNGPIKHQLALNVQSPDGKLGAVNLDGDVRLFNKGKLAPESIDGNVDLKIKDLALDLVNPFLPPGFVIDQMQGNLNGGLTLNRSGSNALSLKAEFIIANLIATGPIFDGDVYRSSKIRVVCPQTTIDRSDNGRILIDKSANFAIESDEGTTYIAANATMNDLMNLAKGQSPAEKGFVGAYYNYDLSKFAAKLPKTIRLQPDVSITSGRLDGETHIDMEKDSAQLSHNMSITGISGRNGDRPFTADPLIFSAHGRITNDPRDPWRDILVKVDSNYIKVEASGPSLSQMGMSSNLQMAELTLELGQFVDLRRFGIASMTGNAKLTLATTPPTAPGAPSNFTLAGDLRSVSIRLYDENDKPIPFISDYNADVDIAGTLSPRRENRYLSLSKFDISDSIGLLVVKKDPQEPFRVQLPESGQNAASGQIHFAVGLKRLSEMVCSVRRINPSEAQIQGGLLEGDLKLTSQNNTNAFALDATLRDLKLAGTTAPQKTATLELKGSANDDFTRINIPSLVWDSDFADLSLDKPLNLRFAGNDLNLSGAIKGGGDVSRLSKLLEALGLCQPGMLSRYNGTIAFNQALETQGDAVSIKGRTSIANFTVGNPQKPDFKDANLLIANDLTINSGKKTVNLAGLNVDMTETKALSLSLKGNVLDYNTRRQLDGFKILLSYDLAQLFKAAKPMIEASLDESQRKTLADLKITGIAKNIEVAVTGQYPVNNPKTNKPELYPIRYLQAYLPVRVDDLQFQGIHVQAMDLPVSLKDGIVQTLTLDNKFAKPAKCNEGEIDLSGWQVALAQTPYKLNCTRQDYLLVNNVNIQEKSIAYFLGQISPLFYGTEKAKGFVTVKVNQAKNLPWTPRSPNAAKTPTPTPRSPSTSSRWASRRPSLISWPAN